MGRVQALALSNGIYNFEKGIKPAAKSQSNSRPAKQERRTMSEIRSATLKEGGQLLTDALLTYEKAINEGYLKCEKDFTIALSLKIKPAAAEGDFDLEAGISFTKDKVKDTFSRKVRSTPLFDQDLIPCPIRVIQRSLMAGQPAKLELVEEKDCEKCELRCEVVVSEPNAKGEVLEQGRSCPAWADQDCQGWLEAFVQDSEMLHEDKFPYILDDDMPWVTEYSMDPKMFLPRSCRVCGCTDEYGCDGGCGWVDGMQDLCTTCAGEMDTYRVRNKQTGAWWEGPAESPEKAAELAGGGVTQYEDYEVRVRTAKGGWGKPKPSKNACGSDSPLIPYQGRP